MPKLAGVALLLRLVSLAGSGAVDLIQVLVLLAVVSMTFGNLAALVQKDLKRLLAYSSIAHAGYVMLGVLTLNSVGFSAAVFHISAYLLMNLACFLVICAVSREGENVTVSDLSGLYHRSPLLAFTLSVGAFALAGIPPTAGFTGKFFLFTAALNQGHLALVIIAAVNTADFNLLLPEYRSLSLRTGPRWITGGQLKFFQPVIKLWVDPGHTLDGYFAGLVY